MKDSPFQTECKEQVPLLSPQNEAALNSYLTPLQVVTETNPISYHDVFSIIYTAQRVPIREKEQSTFWQYFKKSLGFMLLGVRAFSILFRLFAAEEFIRTLFKLPGLNETPDAVSEKIAEAMAGIFFMADIIVTLRATKKSVFPLCESADWMGSFKEFCVDIRRGAYPKGMLISGAAAMLGSAAKGYSGISTMFSEELSGIPHVGGYLKWVAPEFAIGVAASSAMCFTLFQFCDKARSVLHAYEALELSDNWHAFKKEYDALIRANNRQGMRLNIGAGLFSAVAIFYSNGHFEFSPYKLGLFLIVALGTIYFNYYYTYNEIHKLREFKKIHEQQVCNRCEVLPEAPSTVMTRAVGTVGAVGDACTYMLSVVRTFQMIFRLIGMARNEEDKFVGYSKLSYAIAGFLAASAPIAVPAGLQGWSLWTGGMFATRKPLLLEQRGSVNAMAPPCCD